MLMGATATRPTSTVPQCGTPLIVGLTVCGLVTCAVIGGVIAISIYDRITGGPRS